MAAIGEGNRRLVPLFGRSSSDDLTTASLPRLRGRMPARDVAKLDTISFQNSHPPVLDQQQSGGRGDATTHEVGSRPSTAAGPQDPPDPPVARERSGATPSVYRPELQGLRALAAIVVVVYHVWVGRVSGGVDVFFAITGFLAAGQLLRASERGTLDLIAHWGRVLRRLVPMTAFVLVGTMVAALMFLPESRWPQTVREVVASALFLENWQLAADSVDYYADNSQASVVQHFWSLSIQGQFAIAFPAVVLVAAFVARRLGASMRAAMVTVLVAATAASFTFSVWLTSREQQLAYFHTGTRIWEFTLGGLVALGIGALVVPRAARWVLGWLGVVGLLLCGVVLDVEGGFPGYLALWPVACAAFVLIGGSTGSRVGADRLLSSRPLRYIGDISFPLYLWHWPVLLFAMMLTGNSSPGPLLGSAVIGLSLVLAMVTYHAVETPLLAWNPVRSTRWSGHVVMAVTLVPVLIMAASWSALTTSRSVPAGALGDPNYPGAMILVPGFEFTGEDGAPPLPPTVAAYDDWVDYERDCVQSPERPNLEICTWAQSEGEPTRTIVVAGDSHMQQFLPALTPVAEANNWRVLTMIRPGCPLSTTAESNIGEVPCIEWNASAIAELEVMAPDAVVATASHDVRPGPTEETTPQMVEAWQRLDAAGIPVLAVRDNPRFEGSPPSCIDINGRDAPECELPREAFYDGAGSFARVDTPPNVTYLDTADLLCTADRCPAEIGNVIVYLDDNHLTGTYAASMAPVVGEALERAVRR